MRCKLEQGDERLLSWPILLGGDNDSDADSNANSNADSNADSAATVAACWSAGQRWATVGTASLVLLTE
jgi:hypothetical protein